jgi:hypothetical protein
VKSAGRQQETVYEKEAEKYLNRKWKHEANI